MFEFLNFNPDDAINLIKADHDKVKGLFDDYKKAESRQEKLRIAAETIKELRMHAVVEEEIFYPSVRKQLEKKIMNEADEEHHVAKFLIAELAVMTGNEDHYDSKYHVLSENIVHHIKEEEGDMLPKARSLDLDFVALGLKMQARKEEMKRNGIPATTEDNLIAPTKGRVDSPADAAKLTKAKSVAGVKKPAAKKPAARKSMIKTAVKKAEKVLNFKPKKKAKASAKPAAKKTAAKKSAPKKTAAKKAAKKSTAKKPAAKHARASFSGTSRTKTMASKTRKQSKR